MTNRIYEPHIMDNPELPFIFHLDEAVKSNGYLYPNWHANTEILYCISGSGTVKCETKEFLFSCGELFVCNSNILHTIFSDTGMRYYCLIIDQDFCNSNGIFTGKLHFHERIHDTAASEKFEQIITAYGNAGMCRTAKIRHAVLGLLIFLRESYTASEDPMQNDSSAQSVARIKDSMMYICQNLTRPLTLDELSAHAGLSKFYFSREFKRVTGQTVVEYIHMVRCKEAKRLIAEGMPVSAAAVSCGFENMSYFSRIYKRCMGYLPSKSNGFL